MKIYPFKMKVTPEQSTVIQATLFSYNYKWITGDQTISCLNSTELYFENTLTHTKRNIIYFNQKDLPELTFEEFKKLYIKEPMETKTFSIQIPEGFEIDKENSTFEKIVFKELPKKPIRITKWEDFKTITGWRYDNESNKVFQTSYNPNCAVSKTLWPTKELAEADQALRQLIRFRDNWNEGWVANWDNREGKYCITIRASKIETEVWANCTKILSFKDSLVAQEFLKVFKDLIIIAKPLL